MADRGDAASPLGRDTRVASLTAGWLPCALRKPFPWEAMQKAVQPGDMCIGQGRENGDPIASSGW